MNIAINAEQFALASKFSSSKDVRYYLNGVAIQPAAQGGAYIVATNGHLLGVFYDAKAQASASVIIPNSRDLVKACTMTKSEAKKGGHRLLCHDGISATVYADGMDRIVYSESISLIDGRFPDWTRVVPRTIQEYATVPAVNPGYLERFTEVAKSVNSTYPSVRIYSGETPDDGVAVLTDRPDFVGVLMPMKKGHDSEDMPDWLPQTATEPALETE